MTTVPGSSTFCSSKTLTLVRSVFVPTDILLNVVGKYGKLVCVLVNKCIYNDPGAGFYSSRLSNVEHYMKTIPEEHQAKIIYQRLWICVKFGFFEFLIIESMSAMQRQIIRSVELSTVMAINISNKITNFIKIRSFILKRSWVVDINVSADN